MIGNSYWTPHTSLAGDVREMHSHKESAAFTLFIHLSPRGGDAVKGIAKISLFNQDAAVRESERCNPQPVGWKIAAFVPGDNTDTHTHKDACCSVLENGEQEKWHT